MRYDVAVSQPLIPYIQLPEIPLTDTVVSVVLGIVGGGFAGSVLRPAVKNRRVSWTMMVALAAVGGVIGWLRPIHLFDAPSIKPFGVLVAIGVYVGSIVAVRHARQRNLNLKKMNEYIFWVVGSGFVGGHVLDAIFYHPDTVAQNPLYLFALWKGLSSFGGFTGAVIGAFAWRTYRGEKIMPYSEPITSALPLAWVFGRAGCASVHDHPGRLSDAWFAVRYPSGHGIIGRFDLGLYECLLTIPLAVTFLILWRRRVFRPLGFYTSIMCISYAPVRFLLDFLREREGVVISGGGEGDPRYGGLTPAQWACLALFVGGLYYLRMAIRDKAKREIQDTPSVVDEAKTSNSEG